MKIKTWIKMGFKVLKVLLIIFVAFLLTNTGEKNKKVFIVENFHLNKTFGLVAKVEKEEEEKPLTENVLATYIGDLTGYSADCPLCGGTLACKSSYNVYKNNVVTYNDSTFGEVRIVASSTKLPCGSIVKFNSLRISNEPVIAIVLDRGVLNRDLDLLVPSESYAYKYVGRSKITYDVLRNGW